MFRAKLKMPRHQRRLFADQALGHFSGLVAAPSMHMSVRFELVAARFENPNSSALTT